MSGALAALAERFLRGHSSPAEDRRLVRELLARPELLAAGPGAPAGENYRAALDRVAARLPLIAALVLRAEQSAPGIAVTVEGVAPRKERALHAADEGGSTLGRSAASRRWWSRRPRCVAPALHGA